MSSSPPNRWKSPPPPAPNSSATTATRRSVGGGFFGKAGDSDQGKTLHQGSAINAGGKLIVKAEGDVHISGSQVRGTTESSVITDKGLLIIDGVRDTSDISTHNKDNKFLNISKNETRANTQDNTTVRSELTSDTNLTLKSARDIDVVGSTVKAGGTLNAQAAGDVNVRSAQNTVDSAIPPPAVASTPTPKKTRRTPANTAQA